MNANNDHFIAATAIMLYCGNRRPLEVIDALFPNAAPVYVRKWLARWSTGQTYFYGCLDTDHQRRFVELAIAAYGDEAAGRVAQRRS